MDRPMYIYSPVWSARAGSTSNTCQRQQRSTWKETIWQEHFKNGLAWTGSAVSPLPSATVAAGSFPDRLWDEKANSIYYMRVGSTTCFVFWDDAHRLPRLPILDTSIYGLLIVD